MNHQHEDIKITELEKVLKSIDKNTLEATPELMTILKNNEINSIIYRNKMKLDNTTTASSENEDERGDHHMGEIRSSSPSRTYFSKPKKGNRARLEKSNRFVSNKTATEQRVNGASDAVSTKTDITPGDKDTHTIHTTATTTSEKIKSKTNLITEKVRGLTSSKMHAIFGPKLEKDEKKGLAKSTPDLGIQTADILEAAVNLPKLHPNQPEKRFYRDSKLQLINEGRRMTTHDDPMHHLGRVIDSMSTLKVGLVKWNHMVTKSRHIMFDDHICLKHMLSPN